MNPSKNDVVVFVSGIFNTIHPGHIRFFRFAAEQGTRLIVGVFSDQMIESPNVLPQAERELSLRALSGVHDVIIIDNDLESKLREIKPSVVVKGKEFKDQVNVEKDVIKPWEGRLIFSSGEQLQTELNLLHEKFSSDFLREVKPQPKFFQRHNIVPEELRRIISQFSTLKVAVLGDVIVDEYVDCEPVGMSQEDPTLVVTPLESRRFLGGAGIVAAHAKSLGASVDFYSVTGSDKNGDFVHTCMENYGIHSCVVTDKSRPTTTKRRYRAANKSLLRVNKFKKHDVELELREKVTEEFRKRVHNYDLVIFSDFSMGFLRNGFLSELQRCCVENNVPMAADSQTSSQVGDLSKFKNLLLASPTEHEVRVTMKDTEESLVKLSEKLMSRLDITHVLATMGESGSLISSRQPGKKLIDVDSLEALNQRPVDVAGAGDAMLVSSALALVVGATIWQAGYIGALTSACQVARLGNVPISAQELITKTELI